MTLAVPTLNVNFKWDGVHWTDESHYCRGFQSQRGRQNVTDQFGAGQCTLTMRNLEGRFSPFNPGSQLYGQIVPGVPVQVIANYNGTPTTMFTGNLVEADQKTKAAEAQIVFTCLDGLDLLRQGNPNATGQTLLNTTAGNAAQEILTAFGWQGGLVFQDGGGGSMPLPSFVPSGTPLQALQTAVAQELGGRFYVNKAGQFVYEFASYRVSISNSPTFSLTEVEDMALNMREEDIVTEVDYTYSENFYENGLRSIVFQLSNPFPINVGQSWTFRGQFSGAGAVNVQAPIVWGIGNTGVPTNPPGDPHGQPVSYYSSFEGLIDLVSFTAEGSNFTAVFQNNGEFVGGGNDAVAVIVLYGQQIFQAPAETYITKAANPRIPFAPLVKEAAWVVFPQAPGVIETYANKLLGALSVPHPRPVITLVGKTDALMQAILGAEISQVVNLQDHGGSAVRLQ